MSELNKSGKKTIFAPFRWILIQAIAYYLSAGTFYIPVSYYYFITLLFTSAISGIIMWKYIPDLANQRSGFKKDTKRWDLILVLSFILISILIVPIAAGFDVRYQWSQIDFKYIVIAYLCYLFSFMFQMWAMIVNRHFEGTVRIQKDRDHKVVKNGPYKIIRHSGYLAMLITNFAIPFMLGSYIALLPALVVFIIIIIRTKKEDVTLQKELTGYADYTSDVKYRLVPLIW